MRLANKVAIITGSSRGIGRATAIEFAKEGASVVVNYASSESSANEVVQKIESFGSKAVAIKGDVGTSEDRQKIVDTALAEFGKIDILVNNAGFHFVCSNLDQVTEEIFKKTLAVNLEGTFFMTRLVVPHMIRAGGGSIINTSTASTFVTPGDSPQYFSSKGGIEVLTRSLASILAPSIRVNCIAPGSIDTELFAHHSPEGKKFIAEHTPMQRLGRPEEVAKATLFLASDEASFVTGVTLLIDGGKVTGSGKVAGFGDVVNSMKQGMDRY